MAKQPKVSILVPCYNVEKYIKECMDSIVNQTLKDIEIICINDGSKDNTLSILQEYASKDARVKIIDKPNSGYGHSMNRGLEMATGEYIGIVESDDFVELNMFEALYNLAKIQKVKVVKSNYYQYTSLDGNKKVNLLPKNDLNKVINPRESSSIFFCKPAIWSAIYERDFINSFKINFLESPGASYQDTGFNFKVWAMVDKAYLCSDAYLHYRCDNENSSVKSKDKVFCVADEWANIEEYISKYPEIKKNSYVLRNHVKLGTYNWNLGRLTDEKQKEFLQLYIKEYKEAYESNGVKKEYFTAKGWAKFLCTIYPDSLKLKLWFVLVNIARVLIKSKIKNNKKCYFILFGLIKVFERKYQGPTFLKK